MVTALSLVVKSAPVTAGALRLGRTGNVYCLYASVGEAEFVFGRATTTRDTAMDWFEEERAALSLGMDITDPASGWAPMEA